MDTPAAPAMDPPPAPDIPDIDTPDLDTPALDDQEIGKFESTDAAKQ